MWLVIEAESVGQDLPAATEHLQWLIQKCEENSWSLCEAHLPGKKRKSSLVQKGIYSTSGFLPHRSHLSCRAPVTFLLLLKPDWCCRGCCGLLDKRGGDAKADVFQSCYAQTPPPAAESSYKTAGQMKCSKPSHIPALTTFWCPALNLRLRVELHSTCFWSHALKDSFHFEQCAGVAGSSAGFVYMHQNLQFFLWKNSSL